MKKVKTKMPKSEEVNSISMPYSTYNSIELIDDIFSGKDITCGCQMFCHAENDQCILAKTVGYFYLTALSSGYFSSWTAVASSGERKKVFGAKRALTHNTQSKCHFGSDDILIPSECIPSSSSFSLFSLNSFYISFLFHFTCFIFHLTFPFPFSTLLLLVFYLLGILHDLPLFLSP